MTYLLPIAKVTLTPSDQVLYAEIADLLVEKSRKYSVFLLENHG